MARSIWDQHLHSQVFLWILTFTILSQQEVPAMIWERKQNSSPLVLHGVLMLSLGMALCSLGSFMTNPKVDSFGYAAAAVLASGYLLFAGYTACREAWAIGKTKHRELPLLLLVGVASIACEIIFWLFQSIAVHVHILFALAGLYGIVWGIWILGLALHLHGRPGRAGALCVLAGATSALGILFAAEFQFSDLNALTALAFYTSLIGTQMLMMALYLQRHLENGTRGASISTT